MLNARSRDLPTSLSAIAPRREYGLTNHPSGEKGEVTVPVSGRATCASAQPQVNSESGESLTLFGDDANWPNPIEPFLRWVGGKRRLVPVLLRALPRDISNLVYHEPFLGAGALFLAMQPGRSRLSDANKHLIDCYVAIRDKPAHLSNYLREHALQTSEDYYYQIRNLYNDAKPSAAQAARFIYLNKTCFNGIFRVNRQGAFNVPYGWKEPPRLPDSRHLQRASVALRHSKLRARDFEDALADVKADDFVYLDPPYPPLNGTAYFTHYTADRFDENDQRNLAECVASLHKRGAKFIMSNADTPLIRELYRRYTLSGLSVTRYVTCKSHKHRADELLIANFPIRPLADD